MAASVITADTSVVIPLVSEWHDAHPSMVKAAREVNRLPAHVLLESIAVLTRLPGGLAADPRVAVEMMEARFFEPPLVLGSEEHRGLITTLAAHRLRGGQTYDALIAATARKADAVLLTRDRRAEATYRAVGVETRYLD